MGGGGDMMTIECAVSIAYKTCSRLAHIIEHNESNWKCLDAKRRSEMGMIRCMMHTAGVTRDRLPEMPYLDPAHLDAFNRRKEAQKAEQVEV